MADWGTNYADGRRVSESLNRLGTKIGRGHHRPGPTSSSGETNGGKERRRHNGNERECGCVARSSVVG